MIGVDEFIKYWPFLAAGAAFIGGYSNLKSDHQSLRRDFEKAQARHDQERKADNEMLQRTLDQLREDAKETRNDVKTLLQRRE